MKRNLYRFLMVILMLLIMMVGVFNFMVNATSNTEYTITYHLDGGTNALKNPDVYTSEDVITLKDATKEGYSFVGWYLDEAKTQKITTISYRTGNIDLYAKFSANTYTATFNGNGADECGYKVTLTNDKTGEKKYVYLNNGESFSPHEYWKPTASGYVYAGWMYKSNVLSDTLKINSDIELVPKWISNPNNYPVLGDDVSSISSVLGWSGSEYIATKARFYISYDYEGFSYQYYLSKYAYHGSVKSYSGLYIGNATKGTMIQERQYSFYNSESNALNSISGSGSWIDSPETLYIAYVWGSGSSQYPINARVTITPMTKRTNIGRVEAINTIDFNESFNAPSAYKNGYTFLGWYDSYGNPMTNTWNYTSNKTFSAKWEPTKYTISYELNDGINNSANPAYYTIEDIISLQNPSKAGYTFKGWYSDANFTTQVTSISNKAENITLYAKWEVNSYNLTLDANNGAFAPKVTFISDGAEIRSCYLYNQDIITAYRPNSKEGYIFAGWYTDETFTTLFKFNQTIANDITLYAQWIRCDSNIINIESVGNFNLVIQGKTEQLYAFAPLADGKITVTSESNKLDLYGILYDAGKNVLVSADDINDADLDFTYTYRVKAGELYYIAVKGNTASTTGQANINITWTGDCTITGTTYQNKQISVVYDSEYNLPEKPKHEGFIFLGWFDENGIQVTDGTWNFTTDKTLTAKWESVADHSHTYSEVIVENNVNPDCIVDGSYDNVIYCTLCDAELRRETVTVDALGHTDGEVVVDNNVNPTCTVEGSYDNVIYCTVCDAELRRETVTVDALGNNYSTDWTIDIAPTCTTVGSKSHHCTRCGDRTEVTEIPALGHDYGDEWTILIEPTCIAAGYKGHHCSRCLVNDDITEIPATGQHINAEAIVENKVDATCTTNGSYDSVVYCAACNTELEREQKIIDKLKHAWYTIGVTPPTCTTEGYDTYSCQNCGDILTHVNSEANGHSWSEWYEIEAPTCTQIGTEEHKCSVCQYAETKTTNALGHDYSAEWNVDVNPTCTTAGSKSHHCSRCDDKADITEISANGHKYGDWYEIKASTCTETGTNEHKCSVCQHTEIKTTNVLGHTESTAVTENRIEPTCTDNGSYDSVVYCLVCDEELSREQKSIDSLGHDYSDEWTVDTQPTCTVAGSKSHHCLRCDYKSDITEISAIGHTYDDDNDVTCNRCGCDREIITTSLEIFTEITTEENPEETTEESTEESTVVITEITTEENPEETMGESTDKSSVATTEGSTEIITEINTEELTEKATESNDNTPEESGCGSVISGGMGLIMIMAFCANNIIKKKED